MRDRTVTRVESWDSRPFSGGFGTLRELSDASFSGVVVADGAWLFVLNGRVVGIVDGDIDDFEDASGTMYEAPDPALPLLFSMQERGGTTQAKYYTNDTALEEADRTLSDANFTGYVELSENVLSGDYFLVYYGGRALPVAFVGTTDELKTGDEAYELAADEVGVYEVIKTPVNVTQIPDPGHAADDEPAGDVTDEAPSSGGVDSTAVPEAEPGASTDASPTDESTETPGVTDTSQATEAATDATANEPVSTEGAEERSAGGTPDPIAEAEPEPTTERASGSTSSPTREETTPDDAPATSDAAAQGDAAVGEDASTQATPQGGDASGSTASTTSTDRADADTTRDDSVFSEEEQWRQTKSIPSLSPSEREKRIRDGETGASTERSDGSSQGSAGRTQSTATEVERREPASTIDDADRTGDAGSPAEAPTNAAGSQPSEPETGGVAPAAGASDGGRDSTSAVEAELAELEARLEELGGERDSLASELESVREERDDLARRVSQLESALEEAGGEATTGPSLTPDEAMAGTNLFVRYGSKGQPTLDDLQGKNPDADAINTNLRIDHHTQFESTDATVDGIEFGRFLEDSSAYRFVSWLVRELPYEVLDAGHRSGLADLYGVVPEIDRAELQGVVEVDLEEGSERREFDVVLRDRMGNPLVVADLNDARDPVTGDQMESLVEAAQVVGEGADDLGAAFYVTASFFEPDALENAAAATDSGGLLSRSDRMSYVKLARKRGFHLCLAEDRNETFHLTVPEL